MPWLGQLHLAVVGTIVPCRGREYCTLSWSGELYLAVVEHLAVVGRIVPYRDRADCTLPWSGGEGCIVCSEEPNTYADWSLIKLLIGYPSQTCLEAEGPDEAIQPFSFLLYFVITSLAFSVLSSLFPCVSSCLR